MILLPSEGPVISDNVGVEHVWVREGEDVDLTCDADAVPPPTITWYEGEVQKTVTIVVNLPIHSCEVDLR